MYDPRSLLYGRRGNWVDGDEEWPNPLSEKIARPVLAKSLRQLGRTRILARNLASELRDINCDLPSVIILNQNEDQAYLEITRRGKILNIRVPANSVRSPDERIKALKIGHLSRPYERINRARMLLEMEDWATAWRETDQDEELLKELIEKLKLPAVLPPYSATLNIRREVELFLPSPDWGDIGSITVPENCMTERSVLINHVPVRAQADPNEPLNRFELAFEVFLRLENSKASHGAVGNNQEAKIYQQALRRLEDRQKAIPKVQRLMRGQTASVWFETDGDWQISRLDNLSLQVIQGLPII